MVQFHPGPPDYMACSLMVKHPPVKRKDGGSSPSLPASLRRLARLACLSGPNPVKSERAWEFDPLSLRQLRAEVGATGLPAPNGPQPKTSSLPAERLKDAQAFLLRQDPGKRRG